MRCSKNKLTAIKYLSTKSDHVAGSTYDGPSYEKLIEIRKMHLAPSLKHVYRKPLVIHSGRMQYLFDQFGKKYLDMFGGIVTVSVGHCHP